MAITNQDITKLKTIFATKDDLKRFATKDDLKNSLTNFVTKDDLSNAFNAFREEIGSKLNSIIETLSDVMKELQDNRDERTIITHKVSDHEDRIQNLEDKLAQ